MKTFSEACESTFMRTSSVSAPADPARISVEIDEQLDPFRATIKDVQNSSEAEVFAMVLLHMSVDRNLSPPEVLKIAFSHGVMVGIEMEKQTLDVERTQPDVPPEQPEAKP